MVKACVKRLRRKIEEEPANPRFIETVHGKGYRFNLDVPPTAGERGEPTAPGESSGSETASRPEERR